MEKKRLGLIAGNGKFPILFAQKARSQNFKVIAAGVKGDTSFLLRFFVHKYKVFQVGELQKLSDYFKKYGVEQVIMAGQVNPEHLFDVHVKYDDELKKLFETMKNRKADTIFAAVANRLKDQGIELIDSTFLVQEYLAPKGTLTKRGPNRKELDDIEFGVDIAKAMGEIDVGQTVVIKDKAIVAIEAMEGTDKAILRGGEIAKEKAVIIKMSKPNQDFRFDVPVIGPRTIEAMVKSKASCLAIEAGKTLIIDSDKCIQLANKHNICIVSA